jgi:hypothetical protein
MGGANTGCFNEEEEEEEEEEEANPPEELPHDAHRPHDTKPLTRE